MFLWGFMRKSLTSKAVLMYLAVVFTMFSSVNNISNLSMSLSVSKSGIVLVASANNDVLCRENVGQFRRKCISFSTWSGQKGQRLSASGGLGNWWRIFSIMSWWFERRSLVNAVLSLTGIWSRYFSKPLSFSILPYVLSLPFLSFSYEKAFW